MFQGNLYEIQKPTAAKLVNRRRMLLAWEQGTGKTVISVAAAEKLFQLGKATSALVLGRPGDYWQWQEKIDEFTDSKSILVEAKNKASRTYKPGKDIRYTIVPWSLFRRDYDDISCYPWDLIIADEAQEFRNNTTKTAQLLKRMNNKIEPTYRWALTGTAIGNKLEELYSILYWVDAGFLPPWHEFEKNHIVRNQLGMVYKYKNLQALNKVLEKKVDRKTHADLKGQMPELVYQTIRVPVSQEYENAQSALLGVLDDMAANLSFDKEGNLRETHPDSRLGKAFQQVRNSIYRTKYSYAIELIERLLQENSDNRLVFFCGNKWPLHDLDRHFGKLGVLYTGDQNSDQKRKAINDFRTGKSRILFASNAGKAGLDLYWANYVIHMDIPPSWEVLDQRNKRVTRASSTHSTCVAINLILKDSIEEFYYQVVVNKGRLASAALEGTEDEVIMRPSSLRNFINNDDTAKDNGVLSPEAAARPARRAPRKAKQADQGPRNKPGRKNKPGTNAKKPVRRPPGRGPNKKQNEGR